MKKLMFVLMIVLCSCKSTKTHCDAYGEVDDDIHKNNVESQKKYTSVCTIK